MANTSILDRLKALDSNTVSDALDSLELKGATYGLLPLWNCPKIAGRASTVQVARKTHDVAAGHVTTLAIDATTSNERVLVIAGADEGISCWGDILANAAKAKGIRGTVIDGCCRDIEGSEGIAYPVYGRGVTMVSARQRLVQVSSGRRIRIRGVTIEENDFVIADRCGAVFIPSVRIEEVVELAERINHRQQNMLEEVRAGRPVSEVMHDKQFAAVSADLSTSERRARNPKQATAEDKELSAMFKDLDTPGISDALDKLGIVGQALNIMPLTQCDKVTVGPAFTVRYEPASNPPGSVGDFIDDVAAGDVVVIDNGGRMDCTVWGDIMTQYAGIRDIVGTVIDGVCRDVDTALAERYPLFTTGRWMRTGKDRVQVAGINGAVSVGNVRVEPRDIVVADSNGVVIVPRIRAREIAQVASEIEETEGKIREMIAGGANIAEARAALGYHTLQRRQ